MPGFHAGPYLTVDELREHAEQDKCFYIVFESYDPTDYQYEGPACLSPIDDDGDSYYLNEAPKGVPVHKTSFSMGDWYFSEAKSDIADDFWDDGELHIYRLDRDL